MLANVDEICKMMTAIQIMEPSKVTAVRNPPKKDRNYAHLTKNNPSGLGTMNGIKGFWGYNANEGNGV